MTQIAVAASNLSNVTTGTSATGLAFHVPPPTGGQTITQAIAALGGKFMECDFFGDGTFFCTAKFQLQTLSYPLAGTHTFSVTHQTDIDGDCELLNGDDNSQVCIIGLDPFVGALSTQTHDLTAPEIANIHNYGNLIIRCYQADDAGSGVGVGIFDHVSLTIPNLDPAGPPSGPFYGSRHDFDPALDIKTWF